jgi:hypothetical protein
MALKQDIEGTSTKETFPMRLVREGKYITKEQIETKIQQRVVVKSQNFMNVSDINDTGKFQTQRITDPQDPVYQVMDKDNKKI